MDWLWLIRQPEGQFLERKSCYDRSNSKVRRRNIREVAKDIAETLSAMANADGGTLAIGLEDDGTPTGVDYPEDRLKVLLNAAKARVTPPLNAQHRWINIENVQILVFEVDWSPEVHQLTDGRYLLRVNDSNLPFSAEDIRALKESRQKRLIESRPILDASIRDLDPELLEEIRTRSNLNHYDDQEVLQHYRLIESRNGRSIISLAAVLLFARDPLRWHSYSYIDFVKWEGTERKFGRELNIVKRERIEGPLPILIKKTFETIKPHIRERQKLVDLFFEERFEYPPFAWQEAIINAIAHRDYGLEGTPIEIWIFENRMEIRSPGQLVSPVTIERLKRRERIHASRNPRIVRVLTDWGFMRELGEGIPRMFEVMEKEGLKPPEFCIEAEAIFTVKLYNTPVFSEEALLLLNKFKHISLNPNQKRLLVYAHAHGGFFTSRQYQKLVGVDIYSASKDIKDLLRKGIVKQLKKGGRRYCIMEQPLSPLPLPDELVKLQKIFKKQGFISNKNVQEVLNVSRIQAARLLRQWTDRGYLVREGKGRATIYKLKEKNVSF